MPMNLISGVIFGTSNIQHFTKELDQMFNELNLNVKLELTFTLDQLKAKINNNYSEFDFGIFHVLGNDARAIAKAWMSPVAKQSKAIEVAKNFIDLVLDFSQRNPNKEIFVSTLLQRFDGPCKEYLQKVINQEIKNAFQNQVHTDTRSQQ